MRAAGTTPYSPTNNGVRPMPLARVPSLNQPLGTPPPQSAQPAAVPNGQQAGQPAAAPTAQNPVSASPAASPAITPLATPAPSALLPGSREVKAWGAKEKGAPLECMQIALGPLQDDSVEVKVLCCGICASDIDALGKYGSMYR
jgi:hypothetical protein